MNIEKWNNTLAYESGESFRTLLKNPERDTALRCYNIAAKSGVFERGIPASVCFVAGYLGKPYPSHDERGEELIDHDKITLICEAALEIWEAIAADMYAATDPGNGEAPEDFDSITEIEVSLDADRLTTFGHHKAAIAMKELREDHSFAYICNSILVHW